MLGRKNPTRGNFFEHCFQLFKKNELRQLEKRRQVQCGENEGEATSAIRNTVSHNAEYLGLVPVLNFTSDEASTLDQELYNCNKVYDIAIFIRRQVCVTIKKYNVNKLLAFRFDSSLQKRMKQ